MNNFIKARKRIEVSTGEYVKILREFKDLSQKRLAEMTGIPHSTLSPLQKSVGKFGLQ